VPVRLGVGLLCWVWPTLLWAQAPTLPDEEEEEEPSAPSLPDQAPEYESVDDRLARVEAELAQAEVTRPAPSPITFSGYLDFGFFVPFGDGAGIVQDFGDRTLARVRPDDAGRFAWVFLGDILGSTVNSRGEAADLGPEPGIDRFDSINSRGAMGFVLNEANLVLDAGLGTRARATLGVNVVPRTGVEFSLGDFIELDLAQLEVIVSEELPTSFFVGKVEPVIGVEYKRRKSNTRFGITPSLLARYTIGPQLGLKARTKLLDGWVILAAAVTNQSATQEQFHFAEELDSNDGKTGSARLALRIPLEQLFPEFFAGGLELAGDVLVGAQDRALDSEGLFHLVGFDFEYQGVDLALRGQFLTGGSPGRAADRAYSLDLVAAGYAEFELMLTPIFGVMARADFRNAWVTLGDSRAYLTKTWRVTGGLRASINRHLTVKAEYLRNFEYRELPAFDNDIFTSSLVMSY
jgi:hypothetical protein